MLHVYGLYIIPQKHCELLFTAPITKPSCFSSWLLFTKVKLCKLKVKPGEESMVLEVSKVLSIVSEVSITGFHLEKWMGGRGEG